MLVNLLLIDWFMMGYGSEQRMMIKLITYLLFKHNPPPPETKEIYQHERVA